MHPIEIKEIGKDDEGTTFQVTVADSKSKTTHEVVVDTEYFNSFDKNELSLPDFLRETFVFLLEREPKESILRKFNINVVEEYFLEFREVMKA